MPVERRDLIRYKLKSQGVNMSDGMSDCAKEQRIAKEKVQQKRLHLIVQAIDDIKFVLAKDILDILKNEELNEKD